MLSSNEALKELTDDGTNVHTMISHASYISDLLNIIFIFVEHQNIGLDTL